MYTEQSLQGEVYLAVSEVDIGEESGRCPPSTVRLNVSPPSPSSNKALQLF